MAWRTEGLVPLEETSPREAVCLTRHLTAFGASLFVPASRVEFTFPEPASGVNHVVLLTCAVCLLTYAVMAVILRKLDQLDVRRVRAIPFCGKGGRFKYEILVKTGWGRGSGKGLPAGRVCKQWPHVIVRDLQSARSTFFLVNDWLSVETEANGGLVEKEVLAASDAALRRFKRLLVAELQRGFFDKHVWLSIWDRPPRSRFTRVQRATCCVLLIGLFLGANAVWYGAVGDSTHSRGPVSSLAPLSLDTVAVGLVSSLVVYPVYLAILFLFRMSRSKVGWARADLPLLQVAGGPSPTPAGPQALDVDSCLDSSVLDSSMLAFPGLSAEVRAPGGLPRRGCGAGSLQSGSVCASQQAFAGQVRQDSFLEDSK
ncbi:hypothetical protein Celaphus_00006783, partial [Cervus elaphus hippelaphus]